MQANTERHNANISTVVYYMKRKVTKRKRLPKENHRIKKKHTFRKLYTQKTHKTKCLKA